MTENEFIKVFTKAISKRKYGDEKVVVLIDHKSPYNSDIDLIVSAGRRNLAVLEFKTSQFLMVAVNGFNNELFFELQTRYFIYTDGKRYFIFDRFNETHKPNEIQFDLLVRRITTRISAARLSNIKNRAVDSFIAVAFEYDDYLPGLLGMLRKNKDKIARELKLSASFKLYFEGAKDDVSSFEHLFFQQLLNNKVKANIYHYCSFNRFFQIINDNEIAMHGLPGMNDTTEPNYVDNYLNSVEDNVWDMSPESRATINRRFILSCTTLKDDLLQWRLYGDDGKGSSIGFELKDNLKNSRKFYLGAVKYATPKGKHHELEYLKTLIASIKLELNVEIRFVLLYVWRHFFKPNAYKYEKEVRLLYVYAKKDREKKWVVAEPSGIVNPFVIFKLNESSFPLKLQEVVIGPKKSELKLNVSQLTQMISDRSVDCEISESEVKVYR